MHSTPQGLPTAHDSSSLVYGSLVSATPYSCAVLSTALMLLCEKSLAAPMKYTVPSRISPQTLSAPIVSRRALRHKPNSESILSFIRYLCLQRRVDIGLDG